MNTQIQVDMSPYFNMLEDYEKKIKSQTDEYNCGGIYAIYAERNSTSKLIYIGKSEKDVAHRIASHYTNMACPLSKEYKRQFYQTLRALCALGFHLQVRLLHRLEDHENINKLEATYQEKYHPALCEQINGYFRDCREYKNPEFFFLHHPLSALESYMEEN